MQSTALVPLAHLLDQAANDEPERPRHPALFGVEVLDRMLALAPGDVVLVAGRRGSGKTPLLVRATQHTAIADKGAVLFFSTETPGNRLTKHLVCSTGMIAREKAKDWSFDDDEWQRLTYSLGKLHPARLYVAYQPMLSLADIEEGVRAAVSNGPVGLIVVESIAGFLRTTSHRARDIEAGQLVRQIKTIAINCGCPVLVSTATGGWGEAHREAPDLGDLRDLGDLTEASDVVLMPEISDVASLTVHVRKNRTGPVGACTLTFFEEFGAFALEASDSTAADRPH